MISQDQIERIMNMGREDLIEGLKTKYPIEYIGYCITHNIDTDYVKNFTDDLPNKPFKITKELFYALAHVKDARIPEGVLTTMFDTHPEAFYNVTVDHILKGEELNDDVLHFMANDYDLCSRLATYQSLNVAKFPRPIVVTLIRADDSGFCYELFSVLQAQRINIKEFLGKDPVTHSDLYKEAIGCISHEIDASRDFVATWIAHSYDFKSEYKPILDSAFGPNKFGNINNTWILDMFHEYEIHNSDNPIPKIVWDYIPDDIKHRAEMTIFKKPPGYQNESFKQYFKGRHSL
jgi:hypothetical protein